MVPRVTPNCSWTAARRTRLGGAISPATRLARTPRSTAAGLLGALAHELDAEPAHAAREQLGHEARRALGLGVEHGVAAADVDDHRMHEADAIAQRDLVALARATAGAEVAAVRQQVRVDAVLGVERRDVVVDA